MGLVIECGLLSGLRDYLGVPQGKLAPFAALHRKAIEPAFAEVNALAPFSCRVDVIEKQGRKVTKLRVKAQQRLGF